MTAELDCVRARRLLVDDHRGRLDSPTAAVLASHLDGCAECSREDAVERVLTEQLEQKLPQHAAPLALKRRLAASIPAARRARPEPARGAGRRWVLAATAAAVLVAGGVPLLLWLAAPNTPRALTAEAVNDHLRILARARPLDVETGDVHQVRPWFAGRLDFAPVIAFGGDAEFPLRGSTVEYFLDRRAAVVVYGRRLHTITLLVFRADALPWPRGAGAAATRERGFNVRLWRANGLGYALVSDLDAAELARLAARLGG
jgi:anti-sigma factor RsiW